MQDAKSEVYKASLVNGYEGYVEKLEEFIENKLQNKYLDRTSSVTMSPSGVRQGAEGPAANVSDSPSRFGLG